ADPASWIEGRYSEGDHAVVLRSRVEGGAITSDIFDGRGHSLTQLASATLDRKSMRTPDGKLVIPVQALVANAVELRTAARLSERGLRRLRESIPTAADSQMLARLSQQSTQLGNAWTQTRLVLLQEWGSVARRQIQMTPDEHTKFFDIFRRAATAIASKSPATMDSEIAVLLGPARYADYKTRRTAWLASVPDSGAQDVVP
ncbi:MAG TPA: hypothetical protein VGO00_09680, partial [Kofleriaceae bacterium]|nr:hypothetical protein [Kofleriaceae bacterium]